MAKKLRSLGEMKKSKSSFGNENRGPANSARSPRQPLYGAYEARSLQDREGFIEKQDQLRFPLLLENLGPCRRIVDIGCGWGQFLGLAQDRVPELWGVDESPDRIEDVKRSCPKAKMVICRADKLTLPDRHFDAAVTSQMLHEVKLFGE